ncbi:MAG: ABC transporter substrate-binding protein [Bacteroidia bacterium]
MRNLFYLFFISILISCSSSSSQQVKIGFVDALEDETLAKARQGFFVALKDSGYVKDKNMEVIYRNAQNDLPVLTQSVDYLVSQHVDVIATNATLSTITAVQRNTTIPVCMMVSPSPQLAGLQKKDGSNPPNLFGVFETLEYMDTALALIKTIFPEATKVGTLINQSEPQSREALKRIELKAKELGIEIISRPANSSAETQLVTESLINEGIEVFFALPDNTIFASFETIVAACDRANIPIITSESGLVGRGALAAFGADMYQWGYDSGLECVQFLRTRKLPQLKKLSTRQRVYNQEQAQRFGITLDSSFVSYKK